MSEHLDELARALAQPMPRRRALGVLGVTIAGLWTGGTASGARRPLAQQISTCGRGYKVCSPATEFCHVSCCPQHMTCSIGPRSSRGCPINPSCCDPCNPNSSQPNGNGGCAPGPIPDYCGGRVCFGAGNHVSSVKTPSGADYGLANSQFRLGQRVTASEAMELTLGDGSVLRLDKGASFSIDTCTSAFELLTGRIWTAVKKAVGGGEFQISTDRAVTGPRGTTYWISYNRARKRTTLHVVKGSVEIWSRSSPRKKLLVKAGQTAVQQGSSLPRLTKR